MKFKKRDIVNIVDTVPTIFIQGRYKIETIFKVDDKEFAVLDKKIGDFYPANERIINTYYLKLDSSEIRRKKIKKLIRKGKRREFLNKIFELIIK